MWTYNRGVPNWQRAEHLRHPINRAFMFGLWVLSLVLDPLWNLARWVCGMMSRKDGRG